MAFPRFSAGLLALVLLLNSSSAVMVDREAVSTVTLNPNAIENLDRQRVTSRKQCFAVCKNAFPKKNRGKTSSPDVSPSPMMSADPVPTPDSAMTPEPMATPNSAMTPEPMATPNSIMTPEPMATPDSATTPEPISMSNPGGSARSGGLTPSCGLSFPSNMGSCLTPEEVKLGNLINNYRASVGKARLPFSKTLSTVAQVHTYDSATFNPQSCGGNLHSWSNQCSTWSAVCYTSDHAQAAGMWNKPSEINPAFSGAGFEISASYSAGQSAEKALSQWQGSPPHNAVMIESGSWGPFGGMGIGIYGNYAHVWFSNSVDPSGSMLAC